jgi:Uma2 family endonuclease
MSKWASYVAGAILASLTLHCRAVKAGWVFPEGEQYQCFPHDVKLVRKPDGSFILLERMSASEVTEGGFVKVAPDLAIEVVSPHDTVYELDEKLLDYQQAGVRLIWVVNPQLRIVRIFHSDGSITQLAEKDDITGEDVLPGFSCPVREFFLTPAVQ